MKKRTILILALLAMLFLVAGMFYKRPVTLSQLCLVLEPGSCTNIVAYYSTDKAGAGNQDQWAREILSILSSE